LKPTHLNPAAAGMKQLRAIGASVSRHASNAASTLQRRLVTCPLAILLLAMAPGAQAAYSNMFLFGDSLSDSGNNAFVFDYVVAPPGPNRTPVPTARDAFVPEFPYQTGVGGRYSNGPVWAETFASSPHIGGGGALASTSPGGTNYAYGGARVVGPVDPTPTGFPFNLSTQVAGFLAFLGPTPAAADALYVLAGGGNDARDIATAAGQAIANGQDPTPGITAGIAAYAVTLNELVDELQDKGARDIVVWNTPNIGVVPASLAQGPAAAGLAESVAQAMNLALIEVLTTAQDNELAMGVRVFDIFGLLTAATADPAAFGLSNASSACSALVNNVADPLCNAYVFWDGIHPTAAGHQIIAAAMTALVPEPETMALLALGLIGIAATRARKSR
jgi:outer membrane lipase/esterase